MLNSSPRLIWKKGTLMGGYGNGDYFFKGPSKRIVSKRMNDRPLGTYTSTTSLTSDLYIEVTHEKMFDLLILRSFRSKFVTQRKCLPKEKRKLGNCRETPCYNRRVKSLLFWSRVQMTERVPVWYRGWRVRSGSRGGCVPRYSV